MFEKISLFLNRVTLLKIINPVNIVNISMHTMYSITLYFAEHVFYYSIMYCLL